MQGKIILLALFLSLGWKKCSCYNFRLLFLFLHSSLSLFGRKIGFEQLNVELEEARVQRDAKLSVRSHNRDEAWKKTNFTRKVKGLLLFHAVHLVFWLHRSVFRIRR
jgi:hypothetical protein